MILLKMSNTNVQANRQTNYYLSTDYADEINQLQETSAVADFSQTTNALSRWATSATGPGSDHNLLLNSGVILSDLDNMTGLNDVTSEGIIRCDTFTQNIAGGPTILGSAVVNLTTIGGSVIVDSTSKLRADIIEPTSTPSLIVAAPTGNIVLQPGVGQSVTIDTGDGITCLPIWSASPPGSNGRKEMLIDASGVVKADVIRSFYTNHISNMTGTTLNSVGALYYSCVNGNSVGKTIAGVASIMTPRTMVLENINIWVTTGGGWVSGGTGITLQLNRNGVNLGSAINIMTTSGSGFFQKNENNTLDTITAGEKLSCTIQQSVINSDITSMGFILSFYYS